MEENKKDGKEEINTNPSANAEEKVSQSQIKKESRTFMTVVFVMLGLVLAFFSVYMLIFTTKNFQVSGNSFYIDKEDLQGVTLYKTSLPITIDNGTKGTYNFYLRKDPRVLKNIDFNGTLVMKENAVLNMTNSFNCNGDGIIAVANLLKLYNIAGATVIKDENATCDSQGRYMFIRIEEGNETRIEQFGPACYTIYVKNCEILQGTERFMIETFSYINQAIKENKQA